MASGEWTAAMDELLEIVMRDELERRGGAQAYVASWSCSRRRVKAGAGGAEAVPAASRLAGKAVAKEDPQAELVSRYRRKLSMALN